MCVELFLLFGASFTITMSLMILLWVIASLKNNTSIVDFGWALSFVLVSWAFLIIGGGFILKRLLIATMVTAWGLRLTGHLWNRFDINKDDPRYERIMEKFGKEQRQLKLLFMFLFQGFLVVVLTIPFIIITGYSNSSWHTSEGLGIFVFIIGLAGEYFADKQLSDFIRVKDNKDKVCDVGLWKYSRHPNYFFELVVWIGFFLFAYSSPGGIFALASPIIMFYLLTQVSGIPLAEEQSLITKGDAYKEYQKKTSSFIPLPPSK